MPVLIAAAFALAGIRDQPMPTVARIEQQFLEQRRSIKSGIVHLSSTITNFNNGEKTGDLVTKTTIWFDGKKMRRDVEWPYKQQPEGVKAPTYRETTCLTEDEHIFWSDQVLPKGGRLVVTVNNDLKQLNAHDPRRMYHPRLLGTSPIDSFNVVHFDLESLIGKTDRSTPTLTRARWNGLDCWKIDYTAKDGMLVRAWAAPERGNSIVRLEIERSGKSAFKGRSTIECDVRRVAGTEIWFPVAINFESTINGRLQRTESLKIESEQFNKPLDPKVFTPAGMAIAAGTHASFNPRRGRSEWYWDGKNFVPYR
jgi:hypothetical protein